MGNLLRARSVTDFDEAVVPFTSDPLAQRGLLNLLGDNHCFLNAGEESLRQLMFETQMLSSDSIIVASQLVSKTRD